MTAVELAPHPHPTEVVAPACTGPRLTGLDGRSWCAAAAARRLAVSLNDAGVGPGSRVLLSDVSSPGTALTLIALMLADASIVLLDPGLPTARMRQVAATAGCAFAVGPHLADDGRGVRWLGTPAELLDRQPPGCACGGEGDRLTALAPWRARDDALIMWTSGSTGEPKGLVKSGAAVLGNIETTAAAMGYRADDVFVPLLPITHQYGMSLVVAWWLVGCELVLDGQRSAAATLRAATGLGPTVVDAVPPVFEALAAGVRSGLVVLPRSVRLWCVGGAPLPPTLADDFAALTGLPLLDGYGSTEAGNVAVATLADPYDLSRPLPGVEVEVRLPDGRPCAPDEVGEVWVRTRYLFSRYLGAAAGPAPEWFATGDLGALDDAGRLRVIGRANAVHRGGFTIYPAQIARVAAEAGISLVVVAGPDERLGSHLTAIVADPEQGDARAWTQRLRELLPSYELPNRVLVVDAFPRLPNDKPDLIQLQRMAEAARHRRPGARRTTSETREDHR